MSEPKLIAQFGPGLKPSDAVVGGLANIDLEAPLSSAELLISRIMGFLTLLGSLVFIIMFLNGAFKWISGGDDSAKVQKARDLMVNAVIGLILMVAGYAIIGLIGTIIGIDILNPAFTIISIFNS